MPSLFKLGDLRLSRRLRRRRKAARDETAQENKTKSHAVDEQLQGQDDQARATPAPPPSSSTAVSRASNRATLETLPAELRHHILCSIQDIGDLKALVHASPVYHQHYVHSRKPILARVLQTTLGSAGLVDAYAVHTSELLHEQAQQQQKQHSRTSRPGYYRLDEATVRRFLGDYVALRSMSPDQVLAEATATAEDDHLAAMARFYLCVTHPLIEQFATLFLGPLGPVTATAMDDVDVLMLRVSVCLAIDSLMEPSLALSLVRGLDSATTLLAGLSSLSRTERTRLLRALYRFQLYCNLFGAGHHGRCHGSPLGMPEVLTSFFGIFPPWEVEEIVCIYVAIREKYEAAFDVIQSEVMTSHLRFRGWSRNMPDAPPGSYNLSTERDRKSLRQGTASRGLRVFSSVLQLEHGDRERLVRYMQRCMTHNRIFIEPILEWSSSALRLAYLENRADAQREPLLFRADKEDAPPLVWVCVLNTRGAYRHITRFRTRGDVFWDFTRWAVGSWGRG